MAQRKMCRHASSQGGLRDGDDGPLHLEFHFGAVLSYSSDKLGFFQELARDPVDPRRTYPQFSGEDWRGRSSCRIVHARGAIPNQVGPTRCRATPALTSVTGGALPLQGAGLRRRHAKASWTYLFRMMKLLSSRAPARVRI